MDVKERAAKLRELKLDYEEKKEAADIAKMEFKQAQAELLEYMDANDIEGIKHDGTNFVPTKTIYGKITDKKELIAWAKEHDDDLVIDEVRKSSLNERARQLLDDGEEFPPGMSFRVEEYISQRSA